MGRDPRATYDAERIDERDVLRNLKETKTRLKGFFENCIDGAPPEIVHILGQRLESACNHFLPHYAKADSLALKHQASYTRGATLIYFLSVLSVTVVAAQSLFSVIPHGTIAVEVIAIVLIMVIIRHGNRVGWHRRWLDYRLLAERFRFAVFMALTRERASVQCSRQGVDDAAEEADWVFRHFSEVWCRWEEQRRNSHETTLALEVLKGFISRAWIEDQRDYHQRKVQRHLKKHRLLSSVSEFFFGLTLLVAILHLSHAGGRALSGPLSFVAIILPAAGAAFSGLRAHFEHNRLARRSASMMRQLEELQRRLSSAQDMHNFSLVVRDTETLMLHENAEWHVLVGSHRLETPA